VAPIDQLETVTEAIELIGVPGTPKGDADALIEHPAHRQLDHPAVIPAVRELIKFLHRTEVLRKARPLKFGVDVAQVIGGEQGVGAHPPAQQAAAQGPIAQGHDVVHEAIGQDVGFNPALEQIVGRLYDMQGCNRCESVPSGQRKNLLTPMARILPLLVKGYTWPRRFLPPEPAGPASAPGRCRCNRCATDAASHQLPRSIRSRDALR